jgi:hypothetical protein
VTGSNIPLTVDFVANVTSRDSPLAASVTVVAVMAGVLALGAPLVEAGTTVTT